MGLRGPAPRPTAISQALGNPGHRSNQELKGVQPTAASDLRPPEFLDDAAGAEWRRVAPDLAALGLLADIDQATLAVYCQAVSDFARLTEDLRDNGETFTTPKGYVAPRPEVAMRRAAAELILKTSALFGMTPSGRARMIVSLRPEKKAVTLEDILSGGE